VERLDFERAFTDYPPMTPSQRPDTVIFSGETVRCLLPFLKSRVQGLEGGEQKTIEGILRELPQEASLRDPRKVAATTVPLRRDEERDSLIAALLRREAVPLLSAQTGLSVEEIEALRRVFHDRAERP